MASFPCKDCRMYFEDEGDLFRHLLSETEHGVTKTCPYCADRFKEKQSLKQHVRDCHSDYECQWCDCTYYSREFFERHVENKHILQDWESAYIHLEGMEDEETIHEFGQRLEPEESYYNTCEKIRRKLEHFMHYNTKYKNSRVTLAGSAEKRTALDRHSDMDLVLFMGPYDITTMKEFINDVDDILGNLKKHVSNGDLNWAVEVKLRSCTKCSIQFTVQCDDDDDPVKVDLLPAVDVLHGRYTDKARRKIYRRMKTMSESDKNYFNPSLTELQLHIFKDVAERLKYVIQIVKMWGKEIRKREKFRVSSYFFELVILNIWQENDSKEHIGVAYSVRMVMHALCFCESLRIVWPNEYNFMDYVPEKNGQSPVVLDPANPFRDLAPSMKAAAIISRRAVDVLNNAS